MGQQRTITAHFNQERRYFENSIGREFDFTQSTGPYEYLLGALSGCFYLTLLATKHQSRWQDVEITVTGIKRDTVPTTLEKTIISITVHGATDDDEFTPEGLRHWHYGRYYHKLKQISKVITAAGEWDTPAIVGLCEIENDSILDHLTRRTPLRRQEY